jgi:hypothetical protein
VIEVVIGGFFRLDNLVDHFFSMIYFLGVVRLNAFVVLSLKFLSDK